MATTLTGISRSVMTTLQTAACQARFSELFTELQARGISPETASRAAREQLIFELSYMENHNVN